MVSIPLCFLRGGQLKLCSDQIALKRSSVRLEQRVVSPFGLHLLSVTHCTLGTITHRCCFVLKSRMKYPYSYQLRTNALPTENILLSGSENGARKVVQIGCAWVVVHWNLLQKNFVSRAMANTASSRFLLIIPLKGLSLWPAYRISLDLSNSFFSWRNHYLKKASNTFPPQPYLLFAK